MSKKVFIKNKYRIAELFCRKIINKYNIKSILDIGCGDALVKKLNKQLFPGMLYQGIDLNSGIYKIPYSNNIKLIKKRADLFKFKKKYDAVLLLDVLEHDKNFTCILEYSLKIAKKYIFISLPNEAILYNRIKFLFSGKIDSLDLETQIGKPYTHRHLWCIRTNIVNRVLRKIIKKKFKIIEEIDIYSLSLKFYKKLVQKILIFLFSKDLMMTTKLIVLKKKFTN